MTVLLNGAAGEWGSGREERKKEREGDSSEKQYQHEP